MKRPTDNPAGLDLFLYGLHGTVTFGFLGFLALCFAFMIFDDAEPDTAGRTCATARNAVTDAAMLAGLQQTPGDSPEAKRAVKSVAAHPECFNEEAHAAATAAEKGNYWIAGLGDILEACPIEDGEYRGAALVC